MRFSLSKLGKKFKIKNKKLRKYTNFTFWFLAGAALSFFFILSFSYIVFQIYYDGKVYSGIKINGVDFSEKSEAEVKNYFETQNKKVKDVTFIFTFEDKVASVSARDTEFGYDKELLSKQAISLGRSKNPISDISIITQAYFKGIDLRPSYKFNEQKFEELTKPFYDEVNEEPVEAVFNFQNGRVVEFEPSRNGRKVNEEELRELVLGKAKLILNYTSQKVITIPVPTEIIEPKLTTDKVNNLGIKELIGEGTSTFVGSIPNRIYNISLAASRLNGILVSPGEVFSFASALGDISAYTGYKQAFVISGGKTVLGDGGGVCQVSTTLFRAILNSGLPIEERHAHAYRVGYYEQDSLPGLDATVYVPSVDLKFKNDTPHHVLIQAEMDIANSRLTFYLYGTSDGRVAEVSTPVISNQSPAPPPEYIDDPSLPSGQIKQVDFAAPGASVYFTRTVTKNGKVIISDKFSSNYRPWKAVFLRGTGG